MMNRQRPAIVTPVTMSGFHEPLAAILDGTTVALFAADSDRDTSPRLRGFRDVHDVVDLVARLNAHHRLDVEVFTINNADADCVADRVVCADSGPVGNAWCWYCDNVLSVVARFVVNCVEWDDEVRSEGRALAAILATLDGIGEPDLAAALRGEARRVIADLSSGL